MHSKQQVLHGNLTQAMSLCDVRYTLSVSMLLCVCVCVCVCEIDKLVKEYETMRIKSES